MGASVLMICYFPFLLFSIFVNRILFGTIDFFPFLSASVPTLSWTPFWIADTRFQKIFLHTGSLQMNVFRLELVFNLHILFRELSTSISVRISNLDVNPWDPPYSWIWISYISSFFSFSNASLPISFLRCSEGGGSVMEVVDLSIQCMLMRSITIQVRTKLNSKDTEINSNRTWSVWTDMSYIRGQEEIQDQWKN